MKENGFSSKQKAVLVALLSGKGAYLSLQAIALRSGEKKDGGLRACLSRLVDSGVLESSIRGHGKRHYRFAVGAYRVISDSRFAVEAIEKRAVLRRERERRSLVIAMEEYEKEIELEDESVVISYADFLEMMTFLRK